MDPAKSQPFLCNILLDKVEENIVKIIENHEKYSFHWYNLLSQGKHSFNELLNIPYDLFIDVFTKLQLFTSIKTSFTINKKSLEQWFDKHNLKIPIETFRKKGQPQKCID